MKNVLMIIGFSVGMSIPAGGHAVDWSVRYDGHFRVTKEIAGRVDEGRLVRECAVQLNRKLRSIERHGYQTHVAYPCRAQYFDGAYGGGAPFTRITGAAILYPGKEQAGTLFLKFTSKKVSERSLLLRCRNEQSHFLRNLAPEYFVVSRALCQFTKRNDLADGNTGVVYGAIDALPKLR